MLWSSPRSLVLLARSETPQLSWYHLAPRFFFFFGIWKRWFCSDLVFGFGSILAQNGLSGLAFVRPFRAVNGPSSHLVFGDTHTKTKGPERLPTTVASSAMHRQQSHGSTRRPPVRSGAPVTYVSLLPVSLHESHVSTLSEVRVPLSFLKTGYLSTLR